MSITERFSLFDGPLSEAILYVARGLVLFTSPRHNWRFWRNYLDYEGISPTSQCCHGIAMEKEASIVEGCMVDSLERVCFVEVVVSVSVPQLIGSQTLTDHLRTSKKWSILIR